jgi:chromosome segregation ATPase
MTTQLDRIEARLARIEQQLNLVVSVTRLNLQENLTMASELDNLTAQVSAIETVDKSAETLLKQLAQMVADLKPDQAEIDNLAARINASATALAAAVTQNTPAAPPATPPSEPTPTT